MTINSTIRKAGPFIGNGTASAFPFTFKVFQAADLDVVRLDQSTNVETTLVLTSDYTVTLNQDQDSNPGGTVTLVAGALASGFTLTMTSDVPNLQPTDLTNQGGFYPEVINDALDRATIQIQQLQEQTDRSLKVALSSNVDATLPPPNPNDLIGWDANGENLINVDPGSIGTVVAYATAYCDVFIGNGITTSWTLTRNPAVLYNLDVSINGSGQEPTRDYTLSGTTFTMTTPPPIGARVVVKYKEGLPNYEGDSQDVRFVPVGVGAIPKSVQTKLREFVSVFDFMTQAEVADVQSNAATLDVTTKIQAALNAAQFVMMPPGTYRTTAMLKIRDNQILQGAGSTVTVIRNDDSDCVGKDDVNSPFNQFEVNGIGCIRTMDTDSTTKAFNFSNTNYIKCNDLAATNFWCGVYLARDYTNFGASGSCWYNSFTKLNFFEVNYGVFIDNTPTGQDVNGCFFREIITWTNTYEWAAAGKITAGIRFAGYGHVFADSYLQGFVHHVWAYSSRGDNYLTGLYIESEVVPGQAVYYPAGYFGNKDTFIGGHFDGFTQDPFYDPDNALYIAAVNWGIRNQPSVKGGIFEFGKDRVVNGDFASGTTGWQTNGCTIASIAGGVSGNCVQLTQSIPTIGYCYQSFVTVPGQVYQYAFAQKDGNIGARFLIGTALNIGDYVNILGISNASWNAYSGTFKATGTLTYVSLALTNNIGDTTLFDNVSLKLVPLNVQGRAYVDGQLDVAGNVVAQGLVSNGDISVNGNARLVLPVYANNAAAIAGGLTAGLMYRNGADPDHVCIVH